MSSIPERIGRYRVERLLGQGAMGSVYLGRDPELDRAVAIKTVKDLDLEEERFRTFVERFRNEARAAARLSHPAIVAVYDVGEDADVGPFLVFEYVAGSTLKQILRGRGPLSPEDLVRVGRLVAGAIDTAHHAGVIHRDVKPDNILVGADGFPKLADFGVARIPDAALTKEGQFLGTPCYAAPETLAEGEYGPRTDLFSFAAVLYEAATGVRAFPGDDAISVAHKVIHDDPDPPSDVATARIPHGVDQVLLRGLHKDPSRRFATASALVEAVQDAYVVAGVLRPEPTGTQPVPTGGDGEPTGRSGWMFAAVAVGILAVGIALVAAFADDGLGGGGPLVDAPDAGVAAELEDLGVPDAGPPALPDDGPPPAPDLGPDLGQPDAGADPTAGMSAFERDEAAKDAVAEARRLLAAGDRDGAAAALAQARAFDPGNDDIGALEEALEAAGALEPDAPGVEP